MNDTVDQHSTPAQDSSPPIAEAVASVAPIVPERRKSSYAAWKSPWLYVALVALGLAAWQWYETRTRLADTQQELARRLSENDTVALESRALSKQAQEQFALLQGKLGALEGKLADSQSQQAALEELYQEVARSRDDWALAEVEQSVTLAAQQLQLAGNLQGAVLALQTAEARIAGSSRPQFISLRKVLARDLERLRALPQVDLPEMSLRLESLIAAVDTMPLAVDGRPQNSFKPKDAFVEASWESLGTQAFWRQLAMELWGEFRSLVRIQRFDRDEPALLAPGQDFFLRENLKLRLLNARLALLAHEQSVFRNELKQTQLWVDRYFDASDKSVQAARESLKQLSSTEISIAMPNLNESLSAIKNFKRGEERK